MSSWKDVRRLGLLVTIQGNGFASCSAPVLVREFNPSTRAIRVTSPSFMTAQSSCPRSIPENLEISDLDYRAEDEIAWDLMTRSFE